jgi:hypothetical protein
VQVACECTYEGVRKYVYAAAHGEERSFNDIAQDIIDAAPQVEPLVADALTALDGKEEG